MTPNASSSSSRVLKREEEHTTLVSSLSFSFGPRPRNKFTIIFTAFVREGERRRRKGRVFHWNGNITTFALSPSPSPSSSSFSSSFPSLYFNPTSFSKFLPLPLSLSLSLSLSSKRHLAKIIGKWQVGGESG